MALFGHTHIYPELALGLIGVLESRGRTLAWLTQKRLGIMASRLSFDWDAFYRAEVARDPAISAATSFDRACIALSWIMWRTKGQGVDGDDRQLDNCFEMNDGEEVGRWLYLIGQLSKTWTSAVQLLIGEPLWEAWSKESAAVTFKLQL